MFLYLSINQKQVPAETEKATSNAPTSSPYDEPFHSLQPDQSTTHCHILSREIDSSPVVSDKP